MKNAFEEIKTYQPKTLKQYLVQEEFLLFMENNVDFLFRTNLKGHLTSSAFVIDKQKGKILLIHHKKLDKWLQPGGHCDGDPDFLRVAIKEVFEETGLRIQRNGQEIKGLDIHVIPEYKSTPEHKHYDVRFIFQSNSLLPLTQNHETKGLIWVQIDEFNKYMDDPVVFSLLEGSIKE